MDQTAQRVAARFAAGHPMSEDDFAIYDGTTVNCVLYNRSGVLATVKGKLKIERGSFAFEVWGSKARLVQPYLTPHDVTMDDRGNITIDKGAPIWWVVVT